ncbi:antitoxin HicB [Thalassospira sp. MBR-102]|jgi:predicted XRE-type DNA-binding protein|uniref:Helix-turn-helix domain-containing protein n=2 Tax=Thalassospira TaxID=168934 RepID=A0A285TVK1_9PROT|nr:MULTISPECIES: helix-turn-helix transcriptional regulator [Thalassospira]UKV13607.1 helix-turn-helix domain-containing protein [Thalassospiraceae bacterium SW-3-3]KEO52092.1 Fis family transcriptional regulator [Thalassospira permensis NBRC 106175]MAZ31842.1 Fis family transcriptional regulator [Thalassospira sp.]RCK31174.1 Fis family transcriptional regulator [Thalassospira xiamenensis]RCK33752.1 Fis family transcriptional regulator [Thalassospira xiamenensis]|tara:strand:- start:377 stop:655 length:279 start_codon:yes stop_codon:yes gene_type:complete
MTNHTGSSFDDFLEEEGIREEVETVAIKRVLAWQLRQEMEKQNLSKAEMARLMKTSRTQLERLLDDTNDKVQLDTIQRGAKAVGRTLKLELV